ncbi:MAG: hypothetical protein ACRERD_26090 [Candidatus Binatia bacterium]
MRMFKSSMKMAVAVATMVVTGWQSALAETSTFAVDPEAGNNTFSAVFDAAIGERIMAVSSSVGCTLTVDEQQLEGKAKCSVPLTAIKVDNDDIKTEHFQQWATNKKLDAAKCTFDLEIPHIKLPPPVEEKKPVAFTTEGNFTVCGRQREGGKPERITGTVIYLPAGTYGDTRTLRIRARIEGFDREQYGVSPRATAGWLARVQQLADVVATAGNIDVNIFATSPSGKQAQKE